MGNPAQAYRRLEMKPNSSNFEMRVVVLKADPRVPYSIGTVALDIFWSDQSSHFVVRSCSDTFSNLFPLYCSSYRQCVEFSNVSNPLKHRFYKCNYN